MPISMFKDTLTANGSGIVSVTVGRVAFSGIVTLVNIRPVGSVNASSVAGITLSGGTGSAVVSDVDVSSAAKLAALELGTHFTITEDERLVIDISGADEDDQFLVGIHVVS